MREKQSIISTWIYDMQDYVQMFGLTEQDLSKRILDYPANISSFNAQMHKQGHVVLSADVLYHIDPAEMDKYANDTLQRHIVSLKQHLSDLQQETDSMLQEIIHAWKARKQTFLLDYAKGLQELRYQAVQLPHFPFDNHHFQLALCSDLITHTHLLDDDYIKACILELCRVAEELRIFPLLNDEGEIIDSLGPIMLFLQEQNFGLEVRQVPFETIKGGNAMLRIWAKECPLES